MKLKGNHKKLWDEIGRILWEEWDPIGVNKYNGPDDEYNSYIPSVFALLTKNIFKLLSKNSYKKVRWPGKTAGCA